jgi:hypothetical protein
MENGDVNNGSNSGDTGQQQNSLQTRSHKGRFKVPAAVSTVDNDSDSAPASQESLSVNNLDTGNNDCFPHEGRSRTTKKQRTQSPTPSHPSDIFPR